MVWRSFLRVFFFPSWLGIVKLWFPSRAFDSACQQQVLTILYRHVSILCARRQRNSSTASSLCLHHGNKHLHLISSIEKCTLNFAQRFFPWRYHLVVVFNKRRRVDFPSKSRDSDLSSWLQTPWKLLYNCNCSCNLGAKITWDVWKNVAVGFLFLYLRWGNKNRSTVCERGKRDGNKERATESIKKKNRKIYATSCDAEYKISVTEKRNRITNKKIPPNR